MDSYSVSFRIKKRWARTALVILVTAIIVAPITAYASHRFTDVPDSNTFHSDIAWLADAGVTFGCNPPSNTRYCPTDEVTRGQMAAFLRRLAENQVVDAEAVGGVPVEDLVPGGTLPAGATVRGTYIAGGTGPAGDGYVFTNIEFGYTLPAAPSLNYLNNGDAPTANCPGTVTAPEASPGHLCVYESLRLNMNVKVGNASGAIGVASPFGAIVGGEPFDITGDDPLVYGSWAATAGTGPASSGSDQGGPRIGGQ